MVILTNELKCMESTGTGGCISLMTRISGKILKKLCTKNTSFQVYSLDKKYIFAVYLSGKGGQTVIKFYQHLPLNSFLN